MGRGRAKAKQVKVARQLKYKSSDGSDLERLRAELAGGADSGNGTSGGSNSDYDDDADEESEDQSAEDAWRLGNLKDVLAPVAVGDRDGVPAVEACPAQPFRGQRGRFRESSQRNVAE